MLLYLSYPETAFFSELLWLIHKKTGILKMGPGVRRSKKGFAKQVAHEFLFKYTENERRRAATKKTPPCYMTKMIYLFGS